MAVFNVMQVLMNVYEIGAIVYDAASSDFRLDTLLGTQSKAYEPHSSWIGSVARKLLQGQRMLQSR